MKDLDFYKLFHPSFFVVPKIVKQFVDWYTGKYTLKTHIWTRSLYVKRSDGESIMCLPYECIEDRPDYCYKLIYDREK